MRRYENLLPLVISTENGSYEQHEVFEKNFTPEDEAANVASGLIAIVPRRYKALTDNLSLAPEGEEFEAALPMGQEAALVAGGHIALVEDKPPVADKPAPRKKKEKVA